MRRSSTGVLSVLAVAVVAVAVALAGCGGSKSSSSAKSSEEGKAAAGGRYGSGENSTSSTTSAAAGGGATAVTVKSNPTLGSILAAGPKKLTVYMFMADHGSKSSCYGACAATWPPVTASGAPKVEGSAMKSKLGTTKRSDGTTQLTYAGRPIYYYTPDTSEEDITGQGVTSFGAPWYVLSPAGNVITKR
jgi:predicted lipoprotein with Yx(FWY)xxD motif